MGKLVGEDGLLAEPLDFCIHVASEHQSEHFVITKQRPKRVPKSCRHIPFHEEMTVPRQPVSDQRHRYQKPQIEHYCIHQTHHTAKGPRKMPPPRRRFRVLAHVECPEFFHALEILLFHA